MPRNQTTGGPEFARALNALMQQADMQQSEVAQKLDVWDSLVHRWRKGGGISLNYVRDIADLFHVERGPLEQLAGYGASPLASAIAQDPELELEKQRWHKWFEQLREDRVPAWAWTAYTAACEALAEAFADVDPGTPSRTPHRTPSTPPTTRTAGAHKRPSPPNRVLARILPSLAIRNA